MTSSEFHDNNSTTIDDASISSEKVNRFEGNDVQPNSLKNRSRSNSRGEDKESLERLITNNRGVERIITELEAGAGKLGDLEEPYDIKKIIA